MKIRHGFVSNSSSSSFVVDLDDISASQLRYILELGDTAIGPYADSWSMHVEDKKLHGYTSMDNGGEESGLHRMLEDAGFPMNKIRWMYS